MTDPARDLLNVMQHERLTRIELEDGDPWASKVVGWRRPMGDKRHRVAPVGIEPIVRRPSGKRQAVLVTGRLRQVTS